MTALLKSISVKDFRSIKGTIVVPLDAPVVLIHGQNGTGKTSLLSALELALTGQVPSFRRVDAGYISHLVYKGAEESRIELAATDIETPPTGGRITVTAGEIRGVPLLTQELARFYNERCFLAQATLGRLLELYEDKDTRASESPLTKFVKDLLGLDDLDALIDGLHDSGDVRRFRSSVPLYWETRENLPAIKARIGAQRSELAGALQVESEVVERLRVRCEQFGVQVTAVTDIEATGRQLRASSEEPTLQKLAGTRREIIALAQQWLIVEGEVPPQERVAYEQAMTQAEVALKGWRATKGAEVESALGDVSALFTDLRTIGALGPEASRAEALRVVTAEQTRCRSVLTQSTADEVRLEELDREMERARARAAVIDKQISELAAQAGQLATVLTSLLPHIQTDDCPVCGRDFAEKSDRPLHAHVSDRIGELTERAGRLQALAKERTVTANTLAAAERQRGIIASRRLETKTRDDLKTRDARLTELHQILTGVASAAEEGQQLFEAAATAARRLAALRGRDQRANGVREAASRLAIELSLEPIGEAEGLSAALKRFETHVSAQETSLSARQVARRDAIADATELRALTLKRRALEAAIQRQEQRFERLKAAKERADKVIQDARELARRAREARAETVRRVFNDSLNAVWRDLFLRLAPEEPFVPAFALPESSGGVVEATLETHYRSGGKGGNPRAMLSAGNLNTAALTLFLALHLSVTPTLQWLVIDDPVQSMDEVHIAQMAALLRTLSKRLKRQVIIAVHEKPLFDYLALELSPAFPQDRLITIELGRNADGDTLMKYEPLVWQPDEAIAA